MEMIKLELPEFAFIDGSGHEPGGNPTEGRNIILHIRSASVLEVFERNNVVLNEDVLFWNFINENSFGIKEPMVITLHHSATLDKLVDSEIIIEKVLKPAAKWYCDYCDWEDKNILENER